MKVKATGLKVETLLWMDKILRHLTQKKKPWNHVSLPRCQRTLWLGPSNSWGSLLKAGLLCDHGLAGKDFQGLQAAPAGVPGPKPRSPGVVSSSSFFALR